MTGFPYNDQIQKVMVEVLGDIRTHMADDLPNECVGLVVSDGRIIRLINQARSPYRFEVSVPQLRTVLDDLDGKKHTVVAIYHSHPNGTLDPSAHDQANLKIQWRNGFVLPWIIVTETEAKVWWLDPIYNAIMGYQLPEKVMANAS